MKILIAVDGSKPSLDVVGFVIEQAGRYRKTPTATEVLHLSDVPVLLVK